MSAIGIRRQVLRRRRHLTIMAAVLVLGTAIALHHNGLTMGGMHDHHGMTVSIEMCLGVLTAVGTAVTAVALGLLALVLSRPEPALAPVGLVLPA